MVLVQGIDAENYLPNKTTCEGTPCFVGIATNENDIPINSVIRKIWLELLFLLYKMLTRWLIFVCNYSLVVMHLPTNVWTSSCKMVTLQVFLFKHKNKKTEINLWINTCIVILILPHVRWVFMQYSMFFFFAVYIRISVSNSFMPLGK